MAVPSIAHFSQDSIEWDSIHGPPGSLLVTEEDRSVLCLCHAGYPAGPQSTVSLAGPSPPTLLIAWFDLSNPTHSFSDTKGERTRNQESSQGEANPKHVCYGPLQKPVMNSGTLAATSSECAEASKHRSPSMYGQECNLSSVQTALWMAIGDPVLRGHRESKP